MKDQRGFTLLEILISILILGIALVPMLEMFTTAHFSLKQGHSSTDALGLAQKLMEDIKKDHLKGYTPQSITRRPLSQYPGYEALAAYEYAVQVTEEKPRLFTIQVELFYSLAGRPRSLTLVTKMGDWR